MPGEDFFDPTLFKGIHHVTGGPMRIPCGSRHVMNVWTIEVPEGYAFSMDPNETGIHPDGSPAGVQIQKAEKLDFHNPVDATVDIEVFFREMENKLYYTDYVNILDAASVRKAGEFLLLTGTRETEYGFDEIDFQIFLPTVKNVFIGLIRVSLSVPEDERKQIMDQFIDSIEMVDKRNTAKEYVFHAPFAVKKLSFHSGDMLEVKENLKLPIPDGCYGVSLDREKRGLLEQTAILPVGTALGKDMFKSGVGIRVDVVIPSEALTEMSPEDRKRAYPGSLQIAYENNQKMFSQWAKGAVFLTEVTEYSAGIFLMTMIPDPCGIAINFTVCEAGGLCNGILFLGYQKPLYELNDEEILEMSYDAQMAGFWYMNQVLAGIRGETEAAPPEDEEPVAWSEEEIWTAEPEEDGEDETEPEAYWQTEEAEEEEDETEPAAKAQAFEPAPERAERPGEALAWARREAARTYSAPRTETHSLYGERRQSAQPTLAEQMLSGGTQLTSGGRSERRRARAEATERRILALEAEKAGLRGIRNLFRRLKLQREIDALSEKLARYRRLEEER